jgi:hypothetical protein
LPDATQILEMTYVGISFEADTPPSRRIELAADG